MDPIPPKQTRNGADQARHRASGKAIGVVLKSPTAVKALSELAKRYGSQSRGISKALIFAASEHLPGDTLDKVVLMPEVLMDWLKKLEGFAAGTTLCKERGDGSLMLYADAVDKPGMRFSMSVPVNTWAWLRKDGTIDRRGALPEHPAMIDNHMGLTARQKRGIGK